MSTEAHVRAALTAGLEALKRGEPAAAVAKLREFIKYVPQHAQAQHLLANALGQLGQNGEARRLVEQAIKLDGRRAAFHNTHGNILKAQGETRAALRAYARAIELEPRMIGARFNQALIHCEAGRLDEAADALDEVLTHAPGHFDALSERGVVAWQKRDVACAERHFASAIRVRPDVARLHDHLGVVLMHDGRFEKARDAFERAHVLAPELIGPQLNLAKARRALGDLAGAAAVLVNALQERPEHAGLLSELGGVRQAQGNLADAKQHYLAALTVAEEPITAAALAELYLWQGQAERAAGVIKPYAPESAPQVAIIRARLAMSHSDTAPDANGVLDWLTPDNALRVGAAVRRQLHFCAGDLLHKCRQESDAFAHYSAGNGLAPGKFDQATHSRFVSQIIECFGAGGWADLAHTNAAQVGPLFIVGMPRSGTSLIEQMLGMHGQIVALGERADVGLWPQRLGLGETWAEPVGALTTGQLNALARDYLKAREFAAGAAWVTDKMPLNYLYLGLIAMVFPKARIIHCRRDASAVALSCFRQDFQDPALAFTRDLTALAAYTADYERLMAHWRDVLPLPLMDLDYETLVAQPESTLRTLLEQLDLPFDPACLSFHKSARFVNTASHQQVRQPVYRNALARHDRYATHLEPFTLELARCRAHYSSESV